MSNKIFLGVVVIVLIIAGYVIYTNYSDNEPLPLSGDGVSFICDAGPSFIADFAVDMSSVSIVVAGVVERTLQNTGDDLTPYRFSDSLFTYTFAGESATVTDHTSNTSTVCRQPFDPNNAPYNFGDAGEGGGSEQNNPAAAVNENILGMWRSLDDQRFNREFRADGTFLDIYEGASDTVGVWRAYNGRNLPEPVDFEPENNAVYLILTDDITPELVMYFLVAKLTPEEMELVYMDRGGVLRFTYVGPAEQ